MHHEIGVTTVYVTHDQSEAMTMGDTVVVMKDGVVQQAASPLEVYNMPANAFVAGFIGSPAMNFLELSLAGARLFDQGHGFEIKDRVGCVGPCSDTANPKSFSACAPRRSAQSAECKLEWRHPPLYRCRAASWTRNIARRLKRTTSDRGQGECCGQFAGGRGATFLSRKKPICTSSTPIPARISVSP